MSAKATQAEEKEFDLEEWLREGIRGLRSALKCRPPALPQEFKMHARAARKEMLLAVRSLLDSAIRELEETPEPIKKSAAAPSRDDIRTERGRHERISEPQP